MSVTLLLLCASVAIMGASATRLQLNASRHLKIAIVDLRHTTAARNEFRAHIAGQLQATLAETIGADFAVQPVCVGGRDAKLKLNEGEYDAALVIGEDRPGALQRLDLVTLCGEMSSEYGPLPVSLILGRNDPELAQRLRAAFGRLVAPSAGPVVTVPTPSTPLAQLRG
jgi:hypothetical protein